MLRARLISAFLSSMVFAVTSATAPAAALGFALALFFAFALGARVCPAIWMWCRTRRNHYTRGVPVDLYNIFWKVTTESG